VHDPRLDWVDVSREVLDEVVFRQPGESVGVDVQVRERRSRGTRRQERADGGTLRPLEDVLALLTHAGFSGRDALHIYRAFFGFLNGHVLNELQELVENPDETDDLLRLGLHRLPIGEFPLLRSLAHALASYDGAAELERGLDILLTGLAATLSPPGN